MFLSNPATAFLATVLIFFSTIACGWLGGSNNTAVPVTKEPKGRFPFKTKEPENFQCEIVETAGDSVRRKRVAKKGNWRRVDFDFGERSQRALLQTEREYVLDFNRRAYIETPRPTGGQFSQLTHELLNTGEHSSFEEIGRDEKIVHYLVRFSNSRSDEVIVHYDESIGLPVKQEYFSHDGGERILRFTVELVNFTTEPDPDAFLVPNGFRKVSEDELLRSLNK